MGNTTADLLIWTPDGDDSGDPEVYLATMAQSLEDGAGERLRKQEQFIGCNLGLSTSFTADSTVRQVPFGVNSSWNYNEGMTLSGGTVTVPSTGIYTIQVNMNYLGTNTTPGRINSYLYLGGTAVQFSSTYGNTALGRYSNASINTALKLTANNVLSIKVASYDSASNLIGTSGSSFSVVLTKPL